MAPPKKPAQQKMSLGDFLTDESLGSWADEMENMPVAAPGSRTGYGGQRSYGSGGGMGGEIGDRGYHVREQLPMPDKPPYTAHIGNLSFDVTEGDIQDYFMDCEVTNVRIVEDKLERKPKGFGYVEFASVEGLKKALDLNNTQFSGRNVRVSVAEPPRDRPDAKEFGDWTRKGPLQPLASETRRPSERTFGSRNFDNNSDAGSDRPSRRPPAEQGDGKVRDFGNWERKGPLPQAAPQPREGGRELAQEGGRPRIHEAPREPRERRQSPAWGEGRSQDGSRPPRREFQERPAADRPPTAPELDNQWRTKMRPDAPAKSPTPSRDASVPSSPAAAPAAIVAVSRPKLNLQKRTVSDAEPASPVSSTTDAKASPFGAARPIDTFAREKEIEEKRQLALRQKKEHDDKVREEKRLAKEAAKAEKSEQAEKSGKSSPSVDSQSKARENGAEAPPSGKNIEILKKTADADREANAPADPSPADDGGEEQGANGAIVNDKAVKPREIVRDARGASNPRSAWRGKSERKVPEAKPEGTAETLDKDGWSTVSKPKSNRRGGNQASRAIAS
ncbi:MAG: hypothetical protein M1825_003242 [Sarcosagium campestre]|nr:MAG: hypothetical protein M1825_003242 [Sarcosagium campestre]